jgi:hypothetical protein
MSINEDVIKALKGIGVPVSFQTYTGKANSYITFFTYLDQPESHADDEELTTGYYVQIDVWSKGDYTELVDTVHRKMLKAGVSDEEKDEYEKMKENVLSELKRTFRPEFLNRIDEIIVFHSLNMDHIKEIVALMINNLSKRLDEMNIHIKVDEKAMDLLAQAGFDPVFGARPLQREIRRRIEDRLSEELLKGTIQKSDTIMITADDKELIFTNER